ncbi:MAG: hypothetical protein ACYC61_29315 [Isosphaeraceae bacterium]
MKPLQWVLAVAACVVCWLGGREASAQSLGNGVADVGASGMAGTSNMLAGPALPLFSPTVPSATGDPAAGTMTPSTGLMSSPFATPFLYSSMMQATAPVGAAGSTSLGSQMNAFGVGTNQLGMMMLATQGTGRSASGIPNAVRPAARQASSTADEMAGRPTPALMRRSVSRPGGLASRYFNRRTARPSYPQGYFNRQTRYFP